MNEDQKQMIERFQCCGCVCGPDTKCSESDFENKYGFRCRAHVPGTTSVPGGRVYLGLPRGFNKVGEVREKNNIRLWLSGSKPEWDKFNIPVWAMVSDNALFVRTFCPRVNISYVDVVAGGKLSDTTPFDVVDVGEFVKDID